MQPSVLPVRFAERIGVAGGKFRIGRTLAFFIAFALGGWVASGVFGGSQPDALQLRASCRGLRADVHFGGGDLLRPHTE